MSALGRLATPEQFGDIIIKTVDGGPNGVTPQIVRLRDVARVELGAQQYDQSCMLNGHPSVGLAIYQLPGTNALDVAERVQQKMRDLKKRFPEGVDYQIAYDTTPFISESIERRGAHAVRSHWAGRDRGAGRFCKTGGRR